MISVLVKIVCLLVAIAYYTIAERKVMAAIQRRRGPNVVGVWGLLQPLADGLKLIAKEFVVPSHANASIFIAAPIFVLALTLLCWGIMPQNATHDAIVFLELFTRADATWWAVFLAFIAWCGGVLLFVVYFFTPMVPIFPLAGFFFAGPFLVVTNFLCAPALSHYFVGALQTTRPEGYPFYLKTEPFRSWHVYDITADSVPMTLCVWAVVIGLAFWGVFALMSGTAAFFRYLAPEKYELAYLVDSMMLSVPRKWFFQHVASFFLVQCIFMLFGLDRLVGLSLILLTLADFLKPAYDFMWTLLTLALWVYGTYLARWLIWVATEEWYIEEETKDEQAERVKKEVVREEQIEVVSLAEEEFLYRRGPYLTRHAPLFLYDIVLRYYYIPGFLEASDVVDARYGILIMLAISGLSVYWITLAGWASNSKYAFLGALRSAAQMVSYEVAISLTILPIVCMAGSANLTEIVLGQQATIWYLFPQLPMALVFFISMVAETNRTPFDLPEAEAELVAGYNVEYSSITFSLFFLAEYGNMIMAAFQFVVLYLGGWVQGSIVLKSLVFCYLFILIRATLPRYRYDQLMGIGWKVFLPLATAYFVFTTGILYATDALPVCTTARC